MMKPELRKVRLLALRGAILRNEQAINLALQADLQKSSFESFLTETGFILEDIKSTLKHLDKWISPKKVPTPLNLFPGKSFIYSEAYGEVLIIAPWNYPFQLSLSPLIGAIAAGNTVVLKPSEFAVQTSLILKKILKEVFNENEVKVIEAELMRLSSF
jgi:aldehyde dehydrogenase (NAD+)